jgi:hypothetical protein
MIDDFQDQKNQHKSRHFTERFTKSIKQKQPPEQEDFVPKAAKPSLFKKSVILVNFDENRKSLFVDDEDSVLNNSDHHKIIRKVNDVVIDFDSSKVRSKKVNTQVHASDEFIFGSKSAQMYEEYNVLKTNRHKVRQRRVLVIDGSKIYHKK